MKKNKIWISIIGIMTVLFAVVALLLILKPDGSNIQDNKSNNVVKIKDNVSIISSETKKEYQPIRVTEGEIYYSYNPEYEKNEVIVSGIIDSAPNGFIRKVISVEENDGVYMCKTENAVLTDVFEEAHIVKTFALTKDEVKDIDEINNTISSSLLSCTSDNNRVQTLDYRQSDYASVSEVSDVKVKPSENGLGIVAELEDSIGESLKISGQIEFDIYLEVELDIKRGKVNFGMAIHTDTSGELSVGCKKELFDKDLDNYFNGEYEKELISKSLPNIEFCIGIVPVVITNDLELTAEISAQLDGQIGTSIGLDAERVIGFEYSSKSGKIKEINDKKYLSDGMKWNTEAKAEGELEAGIYAHLVTKLYGSTGTDISVGIASNVEGELALGIDEKLEPSLYGKLAMSIGPKAKGNIVVTVPVIDYELLDTEILKAKLAPFWKKEWEVADPMFVAMQKGDFSCFAGTYIARPEDNKVYGDGEKLAPLELKKDGSLLGGGFKYSHKFHADRVPISVEKQADGSYKCHLGESGASKYNFWIYPVGVIEDNLMEEASYLKDVVYIHYVSILGHGVGEDIIYYSDSIADIVVDYKGDDWISTESFPYHEFKGGETIISGTGVEYKVVAKERHNISEREVIVLETKDKERWAVYNLPAFSFDVRTGISYYNIYKYVSYPDYEKVWSNDI